MPSRRQATRDTLPSAAILAATKTLSENLARLTFSPPVTHVYDPFGYAWPRWEDYVTAFASGPKRVLFLGMNPGPWGMAQTGVPFGEVAAVRDWLGISGPVGKPDGEHPKKPVTGFACPRSEVSGRRLWGLFAERFGRADAFFAEHFVANYCPLLLTAATERSVANLTPDKLPAAERAAVFAACDLALRAVVAALQPEWLIGVGQFAEQRFREALGEGPWRIGRILHPSPASPAANRGFAEAAEAQLVALGVWPPSLR